MGKLVAAILFLSLSACGVSEHKTFETPEGSKSQAPTNPLPTPLPIPEGAELNFASIKKFIIDANKCGNCHDSFGAPSLDTFAEVMSKPKRVTPGDPDKSGFYVVLVKGFMPKNAPKLPDDQIELVRQWIAAGAPE